MTQPDQFGVDPFGGTGTTGLAAEKLGRRWLAAEINPEFADILAQRLITGR